MDTEEDIDKTANDAEEELVPVNNGTVIEEGEGDEDTETEGEGGHVDQPANAMEESSSGE